MIRIGFVGVGAMGQCAHLANYTDLPGCEVVALAELREDLGRAVAQRYGVPHVYKHFTEMVNKEKLDGIVASQQFEHHGLLIPELYAAGITLFTEKPLARSFEVGRILLDKLSKSGVRHVLGYHKRSDHATMYCCDRIAAFKKSGELGKLKYVRILMPAGDWRVEGFAHMLRSNDAAPTLPEDPAPPELDPATQDQFHFFVNYYIHQVNLMRHLLGEIYDVDYAEPSGVIMAVKSKSGIPGILEMSPYRTTIDWQEEALVAFEKGFVRLRLPAPLTVNRPGDVEVLLDPGEGKTPEHIHPHLPWVHAMRQQAIHFLKYIRGESTPLCEANEALDDLRIARDYIHRLTNQ
jgi:predicted dehydrogenase